MTFVDTGYLLALARPHDALNQRALAWAAAIPGPLVTTEYVLWETLNGLSKPLDRAKAHALLEGIFGFSAWTVVAATADLFSEGLALHRQCGDKSWSLTDCISFVVMRQRNLLRALTHDHHFEQAGFEALMQREP